MKKKSINMKPSAEKLNLAEMPPRMFRGKKNCGQWQNEAQTQLGQRHTLELNIHSLYYE